MYTDPLKKYPACRPYLAMYALFLSQENMTCLKYSWKGLNLLNAQNVYDKINILVQKFLVVCVFLLLG